MAKKKDAWPAVAASSSWAKLLKPAPGDLRIIQALVNSSEDASGIDELSSPRMLTDWMTRWGLASPGISFSDDDFRLAHQVRRDLRAHAEGSWTRLKLCFADDCSHIYYDHSTNRMAHWCSNRCGNRHNARRSRRS